MKETELKQKKLIVNLPQEKLLLLEKASEYENRSRNNFIIHSALLNAKKILSPSIPLSEEQIQQREDTKFLEQFNGGVS